MTSEHPALPPTQSRPWVWCAGLVFVVSSTVSARPEAIYPVAVLLLWLIFFKGRALVAALVAAAALGALASTTPLAAMASGPVDAAGVMATDVIVGRYGPYALVHLELGPILADLPGVVEAARGDHVHISGMADGKPGEIGGRRHHGTVRVDELTVVAGPDSPFQVVGNAVRHRVVTRLTPRQGGRGLLAGFLVGDTDGVDPIDAEAMRRSGLSHFTAVSGSNVALFLTLLFVLLGPIGVGPRRRAVIGLLALPVFAAATRFEPSVLRASVTAGVVLLGRLLGIGLETWQVVSAAVVGLVILDPNLVTNVGFQLSVAATAGVLIGSRWPLDRGGVYRALAVTAGAQAAVAPILVASFGSVPLLSPLANLVAAPVVATSTALGALGMIGPIWLADVAAWLAGGVLGLAGVAAGWPQIGWRGLTLVAAGSLVGLRFPRWRSVLGPLAAMAIALLLLRGPEAVPEPGAVVLDVGQGDAVLLAGGGGRFALVDGGPDPVVLAEALRDYGVRQLQLVVLTHAHADHWAGLAGLPGRVPIGLVWADTEPHGTAGTDDLFATLAELGIPVLRPEPGDSMTVGGLSLVVEGPLRRYASPNDQSIVVLVEGPAKSLLLAGDIEATAQGELAHLRAEVLKVPHHGSATSDPEWLHGVGSDIAVISVGDNDFGHPDQDVIRALEQSGDTILRTDLIGDVSIPLG